MQQCIIIIISSSSINMILST